MRTPYSGEHFCEPRPGPKKPVKYRVLMYKEEDKLAWYLYSEFTDTDVHITYCPFCAEELGKNIKFVQFAKS